MTTFLDGPARGHHLNLHRTPKFLRVTELDGKFDALDQLYDVPLPEEKIYAYQIEGQPGWYHINAGQGKGGFFKIGEYRLCDPQPAEEDLRSRPRWRVWCENTYRKFKP